ncbi:MAG: hypothetical protein CTY10_04980 [Methylotenera sp.]|nr:MAG: hypothetical protein CTY10_04980 [Methylotenera sp.]
MPTNQVIKKFYKYATPETLTAILKTKSVRYSSPLKFNDPFDMQSGLHFDFDIQTLHDKILDRVVELISSKNVPSVDFNNPWGEWIMKLHSYYPAQGFNRDGWKKDTVNIFNLLVKELKITQIKYQDYWKKTLPDARVFCVSEERDNLLMWAHYAKDHTGAVLEFLSLPEEDNPLSIAQPVNYSSSPMPFFTENEWINDILSLKKIDFKELNKRYAYEKGMGWSYEKEWRVWYPQIPTNNELHSEMPVRQSELASIYIGCKASNSFADDTIKMAGISFPNTKLFRASKHIDIHGLIYSEI